MMKFKGSLLIESAISYALFSHSTDKEWIA